MSDPTRQTIVIPERPSSPPGGFGARTIDAPVAQEERLYNHKLPAALAYARANGFNRIVGDGAEREGRRGRGGQSLAGSVAGARQSRPRRQWRFARPPPAQGRHGVAARFRHRARVRPGPRPHRRRRGKAAAASRIRCARSSMASRARRASSANISTGGRSIRRKARRPFPITARFRPNSSPRCWSRRFPATIRTAA